MGIVTSIGMCPPGDPVAYRVEHCPHGILVHGESLPADALEALAALAESQGFDQHDPGIAHACVALFAFVNEESGPLWRAEIDAGLSHLDPLTGWSRGTDTGVSAITIAYVLSGGLVPLLRFGVGVPHDNGDFGRCLRLVRLMGWGARLQEVADHYPEWQVIVDQWEALAHAHDAGCADAVGQCLGLPKGRWARTSDRAIREDGIAVLPNGARWVVCEAGEVGLWRAEGGRFRWWWSLRSAMAAVDREKPEVGDGD